MRRSSVKQVLTPMRDRDPSIDFDDLPEIQAEQRDNFRPKPAAATATRKKPARAAASASVAARPAVSGMVYAVLGLIIAALAFLAFQLYAQATKLDARVQELENRLSTTDESLSQSGVAMQLAIQELKGRVGEQQTEVDKLWNSAWKKNQAQLAEQSKKLEALSQGHKQLSARFTEELGNLQKTSTAHAADMKVVMARTETLAAMDAGIKEQAKSLATLKQQLATMESRNTALSRKIDENAGWIESNNAFRQQTNQSLNRLEQQVRKLQPTSTTIITP